MGKRSREYTRLTRSATRLRLEKPEEGKVFRKMVDAAAETCLKQCAELGWEEEVKTLPQKEEPIHYEAVETLLEQVERRMARRATYDSLAWDPLIKLAGDRIAFQRLHDQLLIGYELEDTQVTVQEVYEYRSLLNKWIKQAYSILDNLESSGVNVKELRRLIGDLACRDDKSRQQLTSVADWMMKLEAAGKLKTLMTDFQGFTQKVILCTRTAKVLLDRL